MSLVIALAGKGGSGKTTMASLIIRHLLRQDSGTVLAVDADANANLGESLGVEVKSTIGSVIAGFNTSKISIPPGLTKDAYLEIKLNQAIVENHGFDLITMGRGEGQGCYCYPNSVLRSFLDKLEPNYKFLVMDNEAGLEHLSRNVTRDVDELIIVSNHSVKGVRTINRITELIKELKINIKRQHVVIDQIPGKLDPALNAELKSMVISPTALIPIDPDIARYDLDKKSLLALPDDSAAVQAVNQLMNQILSN